MSKNRPNLPHREGGPPRRDGRLGLGVRLLVTVALLWHLAAVFMAALSVPPSSPLASVIAQRGMQWYLDMLAMNRGHHFFAPTPPAGVLVRYELVDADGKTIIGEFPNKKEYWPRLRYHRHFMLADQASVESEDANVRKVATEKYLKAYARHLLRAYDGEQIRIKRVIHWVLPPPMFRPPEQRDWKLDHPRTYEVQLEVVQQRRDLNLEATQTSMSPAGGRNGAVGWTSGAKR